MDLRKFYEDSKEEKKEISSSIVKTDRVEIIGRDDELELLFNDVESLERYSDFMFFAPTRSVIVETKDDAQNFFNLATEEGVEGVMFKNLSSSYIPGLRSGAMAKLKETKEDIDVVILAAEHGKGKRAGFYSSFIVGVLNDDDMCEEEDRYLVVGKVSSGIKEIGSEGASLENLKEKLLPLKIKEEKSITYFEPKIVLQVRYQEIQKSTTYNSGYALRFPRIISLREDKTVDEVNSIADISRFVS